MPVLLSSVISGPRLELDLWDLRVPIWGLHYPDILFRS